MVMAKLQFFTRCLVFGLLVAFTSSCNPEEDTIAIITVVDQDDIPIEGASVRLFANPNFPTGDPTRLNMEGVTDALGQATFDYTDFYKKGQSGFAVLDIAAVKDTLTAEDIIKILEEEVNEKKVFLE